MEPNKKKRIKALLPLLLLPFAALLFYLVGGGSSAGSAPPLIGGLNTIIPSPADPDQNLDKLSLYNKMEKDSLEEMKKFDPFKLFSSEAENSAELPIGGVEAPFSTTGAFSGLSQQGRAGQPDAQVVNMERKLAELQAVIDAPVAPVPGPKPGVPVEKNLEEFAHLENMMNSIREEPTGDKELLQMNGMLEKILDIQHPQRVLERVKEQSAQHVDRVYPVEHVNRKVTPAYFGALKPDSATAKKSMFYDNAELDTSSQDDYVAIAAVVHDEQILVSGAFVKIRIKQAFYVAGILVPSGSFLYGNCSLSGERLMISVTSVRAGNSVLPVGLSVYDLDGNAGIRIPGSISRDASKQSTDQALQQVALTTLDPSLTAQATTAAVETAKTLISKKVRLIRVTVKSDYPILLKSDQ